jgi:hypothetical protein
MVCTKDIDILNKHAQVIIKIVPEIYHLGRKFLHCLFLILRSPGWLNELGSWVIKVYQVLSDGWWFSPGTPASFTTKTGRHDIVEIFLEVALNTINQKSNLILRNK